VNSNGVLTATCQTANGNWRTTSLSPNQCGSYRAGNRDGNLFCESGDDGGTASRWDGSFRNSCREASVNSNGVLTATCQTANGNWRTTSLSPNQCGSYRAGNRDGNLFCESGDDGGTASRWDGSFRNSCPRSFGELERRADGHLPDGKWQLADHQPVAESVRQLPRRQPRRATCSVSPGTTAAPPAAGMGRSAIPAAKLR